MARSLRIEKRNGVYHVINRGNYRQDLFINEGAHQAFERCLFEACEKCGWVLEGFCVMTNHFHLVIRTPEGNLVYGMKWLQSTFANRYHHFRKVHGKLFQGRYKSLIVQEESYLGALLHYVHLNPVRAGLVDVAGLGEYRWSSYWYLQNPAKRPHFMDVSGCLEAAGGLSDGSSGHKQYADYLAWLAADSPAQKELMFDRMCSGWAIGSKDFKKGLLEQESERLKAMTKDGGEASDIAQAHYDSRDLREANELKWELCLGRGLAELGKTTTSIREDLKSAEWKVLLAAAMKRYTSATNVWITKKLNMGIPQAVSQNVGKFNASGGEEDERYKKLIIRITDPHLNDTI
jgi:REP element-mobilizing transposase RayT